MRLELRHASRTDRGLVREGNEDSLFAGVRVLAVADGMGGHVAGEVASREVISELQKLDLAEFASRPSEALVDAMEVANGRLRERVAEDSHLEGMGTTLSAILLSEDRLALVHVGDSRVYRFVAGTLAQITHDNTLVQQLVDEGRITPDQARTHPQRSLLTQALDGRTVQPQVMVFPARQGERYLLCTDGLSGVVPEDVIVRALELDNAEDAVDTMLRAALDRGAPDNVSIIVADVVAGDDATPSAASTMALAEGAPGGEPSPGDAAAHGTADLLVVADADDEVVDIGVPGAAAASDERGVSGSAAALARDSELDGDDDDFDVVDDSPPRRRWLRRTLIWLLVLVLIVVVGLVVTWAWLDKQWYVGVTSSSSGDVVAIYNGVPETVGPVDLSSVEETTDIAVTDLTPAYRERVTSTIPASSLEEAQNVVSEIERSGLLPPCTDVANAPTDAVPGENCRQVEEVPQ